MKLFIRDSILGILSLIVFIKTIDCKKFISELLT
ncbi:hypothetical protein EV214_11231 [Marinisporobacter balticus]|uniref:Uncharacterized protein n=1 Tax=Marinisporobacter balticus TaxID=2018667 RepID=A0A4R2KMA0_9FIRM|nr:hypothetical protein EV214_11231 [Marinisporobacter balticus]